MDRISDDLAPVSLRLSRVLDDVGASWEMMMRRRRAHLLEEALDTIQNKLLGDNFSTYIFGSQTEGATTPGLGSDIDVLHCNNNVNVMQGWEDWQAGKRNYMAIKEETTPPRHRTLQLIRDDSPEPVTEIVEETVRDLRGRVILKPTCWNQLADDFHARIGKETIRQGPSQSWTNDIDIIHAFRCNKLPPECIQWVNRPRPGQWPTREMLANAEHLGCFILPVDSPESNLSDTFLKVHWRLSPSLVERSLMFSLNSVHLKCYICLKMIKKSFFSKICDDFTSFHCKTVLWFTIENSPPHIWVEHNLLACVRLCLLTLQKFLKGSFCPHFIISDYNLFAGKVSRREQQHLDSYIAEMLQGNCEWVFNITCDDVGQRMIAITSPDATMNYRFMSRNNIYAALAGKFDAWSATSVWRIGKELLYTIVEHTSSPHDVASRICHYLQELVVYGYNGSAMEENSARLLIPLLCSHLATIQASMNIACGQCFSEQTMQLFELSLNSDAASSRLKLASALFCQGHYAEASRVLEDVEHRYGEHVFPICGCGYKIVDEPRNNSFEVRSLQAVHPTDNTAGCVRFLRQEIHCVPWILRWEMYRDIGDDVLYRHYLEKEWMNWAVVDVLPYLYYLQYVTYGALGRRDRQLTLLPKLSDLSSPGRVERIYHRETAANLLGHMEEMEKRQDLALERYQKSLINRPRSNAAKWHIRRLTQ